MKNPKTFDKRDAVWREVCLNSLGPGLCRYLKKYLMKFCTILSAIKDQIWRKKCTFLETNRSKVVGNRQIEHFFS